MNSKFIGLKLIKLRGDRSQKEVSDALEISPSALSMYESGERIPRDEVKIKIAKYYNTSVEALFYTQ